VLKTDWELPTIETLWVAHKFSAIVLESSHTWFLSGPPDDPVSIHRSCISPSIDYYMSPENKKRNNQIQLKKIITYKRKLLNDHTTKCWAQLSTNCYTPFYRSSLCMCISTKSSIGLDFRPRDVTCKKNKCCKFNIFYK